MARIRINVACYGCKTKHERITKKPRAGYPENHGFQCSHCESFVSCELSVAPGMKAGQVSISQRFIPSEKVTAHLMRVMAEEAK